MVEAVERIDAKLSDDTLFDRRVLLERKIAVEEVRTEAAVASRVADLIKTGRGKGCAQRLLVVEEQRRTTGESLYARLQRLRIAIDIAGSRARNAGAAAAVGERKRQAAGVVDNRAELPAANQIVDQRIGMAEQGMIATEG